MQFEFTFELSDAYARQAARRFLLFHLGWRTRIASAAYLLLLALICVADDTGYVCGIFAGAGTLLFVLVLVAYFTKSRHSRHVLRKLQTRTVCCQISDQALRLESALGTSSLPWHMFDKVVRAPDVWLFFVGRRLGTSLPADKLVGEAGRFVAERIVAAGGRIVGDGTT